MAYLMITVSALGRTTADNSKKWRDHPSGRRVEPGRAEIRDYVIDQMHNKIEHVIYR